MSPRKSYWIGPLFKNKNSGGGVISVTEQSCAAPISQVENTYQTGVHTIQYSVNKHSQTV